MGCTSTEVADCRRLVVAIVIGSLNAWLLVQTIGGWITAPKEGA